MPVRDNFTLSAGFKNQEPSARLTVRCKDNLEADRAIKATDKSDVSSDIQTNISNDNDGNGIVKDYNTGHGTIPQKKTNKPHAKTGVDDATQIGEISGLKLTEMIYVCQTAGAIRNKTVNLVPAENETSKNDIHKTTKPKKKRIKKEDNILNELLELTKDVPNAKSLNYSSENSVRKTILNVGQKPSHNDNDTEINDGTISKEFSTTDEEMEKKENSTGLGKKRGRRRKRSCSQRRKRRDSSSDQNNRKTEISKGRFRSRIRKQCGVDKDLDEALKFTSDVLEFNEPSCTTKIKITQNIQTSLQIETGDLDVNNPKTKGICGSEELVTKNNRLVRNIKISKKPCRISNKVSIVSDPVHKRKDKKDAVHNNIDTPKKFITRSTIDDDVYDISPVKNRERLSDSESEGNDKIYKKDTGEHDVKNDVKRSSDNGTYIIKTDEDNGYVYNVIGGEIQRSTVPDCAKQEWEYNFKKQRDLHSKKKKRTEKRRTGLTKKRKNDDKKKSDLGGDGCHYDGIDRTVSDLNNLKTHNIMEINEFDQRVNATEDISASRNPTKADETGKTQLNRRIEIKCEDNDMLIKLKKDITHTQFEWEDIMYDSDTESGWYSGSDITGVTPSVKSYDLDFPRPASDRTFVVSGSDEEYINREKDYKDAFDKPNNEEQPEKKVGRFEKFFRWLFCCVSQNGDE